MIENFTKEYDKYSRKELIDVLYPDVIFSDVKETVINILSEKEKEEKIKDFLKDIKIES